MEERRQPKTICCCFWKVTAQNVTCLLAMLILLSGLCYLNTQVFTYDVTTPKLVSTVSWTVSAALAVGAICCRNTFCLIPLLVLLALSTALLAVYLCSSIILFIIMAFAEDEDDFSDSDKAFGSFALWSALALPGMAWSTLAVWRCYRHFSSTPEDFGPIEFEP
ncbi:hypothetical protein QR680_016791 [Steinernema hermaphroditum]|uniref:Uncharacterized protein n=1 Tax=Steinernema hermaphroditum TaxID=289476 RepID=A0AA39HCB6_9BILA|nr:hypothetical protein QR680_016791 [Steinernema hermaphroditum]